MPNYKFAKVDANHAEIRKIIRGCGYFWLDTFRSGMGVPDCFVLSKSHIWVAFEIKSDGGELTPDEQKLFDQVQGPLYTVNCHEGMLDILRFYDQMALAKNRMMK